MISWNDASDWWYGLAPKQRDEFRRECGMPDTSYNGPVGWGPEEYFNKIKQIHPELFTKTE